MASLAIFRGGQLGGKLAGLEALTTLQGVAKHGLVGGVFVSGNTGVGTARDGSHRTHCTHGTPNMFVVSLTYVRPLEEVDARLAEHVAYLNEQYDDGVFVASGRKVPRTGGVILVKVRSRAELDGILARDPFHVAGLAHYEVTEFAVSKAAPGLEVLLDE